MNMNKTKTKKNSLIFLFKDIYYLEIQNSCIQIYFDFYYKFHIDMALPQKKVHKITTPPVVLTIN